MFVNLQLETLGSKYEDFKTQQILRLKNLKTQIFIWKFWKLLFKIFSKYLSQPHSSKFGSWVESARVSDNVYNGLRKLEAENNMFMDERSKRGCMSNVQVHI